MRRRASRTLDVDVRDREVAAPRVHPAHHAVLQLQRWAGNDAVSRAIAGRSQATLPFMSRAAVAPSATAVVQRQTQSRFKLEQKVRDTEPKKKGETSAAYLKRLYLKYQPEGLDEEDKEVLRERAMYWYGDEFTDKPTKKVEKQQTKEELAAAAAKGQPFVSLANDVASGYYAMKVSAAKKIRKSSGEAPFGDYSGGKSVRDAVEEAIVGLDLSGSVSFQHSRHDFQPASAGVVNLQVQLGGSAGKYRVGKGDTSSTVVVINEKLFDAMKAADPTRWKAVLQAAHRQSFNNTQRIELVPPG